MRLSHPSVPYQGIPPQDVFFAANDLYVQLGLGFVVLSFNQEMYPDKPLEIYLSIDAQPTARDLLLGALLGRAEQLRSQFPHVKGRIYTHLSPSSWEMLSFYNRNGFANADAQEEHVFPLPALPGQTPMGIQFASVPLGTLQEQQVFLARLNAYRMTPITLDFLTLQMQQPYFMALGYYRAGQPLCELMMTGASPDSSSLVMLYTRADHRRKGLGRSLVLSACALLKDRGVHQIVTHIYSRSQAQTGLIKSLGGTRRRIISILPSIEITS
jgi:GNAT superfamily N-acetyltransferase